MRKLMRKILWREESDLWETEATDQRSSSNSWEEGTCVSFLHINEF